MPFYEYQCKSCGHALEAMQKVSDAPLKKCPECGKPQLTRLMSAPVFRLKGGGWYETDFKSDQDSKRNLADRPEEGAPKEDKKPAETAATDGAAKSADKPADKLADKPAEKQADKPAEKSASHEQSTRRGPSAAPAKTAAGTAAKRPARKALLRKPAKPARRR